METINTTAKLPSEELEVLEQRLHRICVITDADKAYYALTGRHLTQQYFDTLYDMDLHEVEEVLSNFQNELMRARR